DGRGGRPARQRGAKSARQPELSAGVGNGLRLPALVGGGRCGGGGRLAVDAVHRPASPDRRGDRCAAGELRRPRRSSSGPPSTGRQLRTRLPREPSPNSSRRIHLIGKRSSRSLLPSTTRQARTRRPRPLRWPTPSRGLPDAESLPCFSSLSMMVSIIYL